MHDGFVLTGLSCATVLVHWTQGRFEVCQRTRSAIVTLKSSCTRLFDRSTPCTWCSRLFDRSTPPCTWKTLPEFLGKAYINNNSTYHLLESAHELTVFCHFLDLARSQTVVVRAAIRAIMAFALACTTRTSTGCTIPTPTAGDPGRFVL